LTRYFFGEWVQQKFSDRLETVQSTMERDGAFYLFTLRLLPAIPFFLINTLMGLTRIHVVTFWWVSQIGMLPGTIAYVYAGSRLPSLKTIATEGVGQVLTWQLLVAFGIVGVLPLAMKWSLRSLGAASPTTRCVMRFQPDLQSEPRKQDPIA